jgi:xanthine dehydrogenase accessory factor
MEECVRDLADLREFWQKRPGEPMALCTLIRKRGSSYRAPGAKKLILLSGGGCGLLSGGCLEADIENTAREGWNEMPFVRSFTTATPDDKILGYQSGCAGVIDILFEQIPTDAKNIDLYIPFGLHAPSDNVSLSLDKGRKIRRAWSSEGSTSKEEPLYVDRWIKPVELYVVGCGIDAAPFEGFSAALGWHTRFLDFRESHIGNIPNGKATIIEREKIAEQIGAGDRTAVILMTHNYPADTSIMAGLANRELGYLGCLGPRIRYEQMKSELRDTAHIAIDNDWEERVVHSPAGLFANGRAPAEIAFSIVADIQRAMTAQSDAAV